MSLPRKTKSSLSFIREEGSKMSLSSTKSCESFCSNNTASSSASAAILYRKSPASRTSGKGQRQASLIPATSEVRQRVVSARRLHSKTYQNKLVDAQQTISNLAQENRMLRTLHKRQDAALTKYESTSAELPQLLHSHTEELRAWQTKCRNLQTNNKELESKLKQKDTVILSLSDQNKHYNQLNKDRNLEERQRLTEKVRGLEMRLQQKDNEMKLLCRKHDIEIKSLKKQIQTEQKKTKAIMNKLEQTRLELSSYRKLEEMSMSGKFSGIATGRKEPQLKLAKGMEPPLMEPNMGVNDCVVEEPLDFKMRNKPSKKSAAKPRIELETSSSRTITKVVAITPRTDTTVSSVQKQPKLRIHRGDGDAAVLSEISHQTHGSEKECETEIKHYDDDYSDVSDVEEVDEGASYEAEFTMYEQNTIYHSDKADDELDEDDVDEDDVDEDDVDDEETDTEVEGVIEEKNAFVASKDPNRIKEDFLNIRKKISNDFKERESFLDNFCQQATNMALSKELPKRKSVNEKRGIPNKRKDKLLAALKSIDGVQ